MAYGLISKIRAVGRNEYMFVHSAPPAAWRLTGLNLLMRIEIAGLLRLLSLIGIKGSTMGKLKINHFNGLLEWP